MWNNTTFSNFIILTEDETLSNEDVKVELDKSKMDEYIPLLTWRIVHEKLAWGVLLLMGGGFALADACNVSQLYFISS